MMKFFRWLFNVAPPPPVEPPEDEEDAPQQRQSTSLFSTHGAPTMEPIDMEIVLNVLDDMRPTFSVAVARSAGIGMDSFDCNDDDDSTGRHKAAFRASQPSVSQMLVNWYAATGFIGHQLAAIVAQHWLILKACSMPARDAIRHGFTITNADGDDLDDSVAKAIRRADRKYGLMANMLEFITMGRIFGVRIMMFKVESDDQFYYEKPFNIDGVTPGSYKGMVQVDPYWCAPELDQEAASDAASMHFYEPTWWNINGKRYHRSHLVIFRNGMLADILKPAYLYGGIPVPQLIMERVYGAERTANEAPLLALTKRTTVYKTDLAKASSNWDNFKSKVESWALFWQNNGVRVIDEDEDIVQIDTALADLDAIIMTQYQIVAAAADVPSVKLLGTTPKGFSATGEFDESSYHEMLESIQSHDLTTLVERHHSLVIKSSNDPAIVADREIVATISWNPLDSPTAKEYAEINLIKAQTDQALTDVGAVDGIDSRNRIRGDKNSDYIGIEEAVPAPPPAAAGEA